MAFGGQIGKELVEDIGKRVVVVAVFMCSVFSAQKHLFFDLFTFLKAKAGFGDLYK